MSDRAQVTTLGPFFIKLGQAGAWNDGHGRWLLGSCRHLIDYYVVISIEDGSLGWTTSILATDYQWLMIIVNRE